MESETIEVFTFSIRERNARKTFSFADGFDLYEKMKKDFIDFIHNSQTGDIPAEKRTVRVPKMEGKFPFWGCKDNLRCIYGIIETGLYGRKIEIVDKDDPTKPLYTTENKNGAVIKPFFFLVKIPKAGDVGYVIFERTDNESIATLFFAIFQAYIKSVVADKEVRGFKIDHKNFVTKEYVKALKEGQLKSVSFTVRKIPKDKADQYMMRSLGVDTSIKLTVKFHGGLFDRKVIESIMDDKQLFTTTDGLVESLKTGMCSVVTNCTINGQSKERTVYLDEKNNSLIRPYYLVDVRLDDNGYPSFESLCSSVLKFIDDTPELKNVIV